MSQKGAIALALPLLLLLLAAVTIYLLIARNVIKIPLKLPFVTKQPTVTLQTQYQNPFDKNAQYVNPFSSYKNPFDGL